MNKINVLSIFDHVWRRLLVASIANEVFIIICYSKGDKRSLSNLAKTLKMYNNEY